MKKISKDYLNLQTKLHENPNYGTASISIAPLVKKLFEDFEFKSISDYGAGKKNLEKALNLAKEVENLAEIYLQACLIGEPKILSKEEMERVLKKFKSMNYN